MAGAILALLVIAPILRPGYVLTYDMVFVPHLRLSAELFGLGTSVPRAVPNDLLVAMGSRVLPAYVLQKLILGGVFLVGAAGATRLCPTSSRTASVAGGVFFVWNAFTFERLVMGHWTLLVSYAALPWAVRAALRFRSDPRSWRRLGGWLAVACFGGAYGGVIAIGTTTLVAAWPSGDPARQAVKRAGIVVALGVVLSAPWLVPSVLHPAGLPVRPLGVAAFGAHADTPLGTVGSVLTLGGIWNSQVVPPGRHSLWWVPAFAVILVLAVDGWRRILRRWSRGAAIGLLVAAAVGFALAVAPAIPGIRSGFSFLALRIPGGGLLRDSQKFAAPLALVEALGVAVGAERILAALGDRRARMAAGVLLAAGPVAILPVLAWGAGGRLGAVPFPRDWSSARTVMAADAVRGSILVLPWHLYLKPPWNGHRTTLNPAQRYFTRRAVVNDDLELESRTIQGEDVWARRMDPLIESGRPLAGALRSYGIRYVLVLKVGPWRDVLPRLRGLPQVADGQSLALFRAPPPATVSFPSTPAAPVVAGDLVTLMLVMWMARPSLERGWRILLGLPGKRRG